MAIGQQNRSTAVSILQIGISHNTKCACVFKDGFYRDSHICGYHVARARSKTGKMFIMIRETLENLRLLAKYLKSAID